MAVKRWRALALVAALGMTGFADAAYTVVRGDSLTSIARKYGTSVRAIAGANGVVNVNMIRIGRQLMIPGVQGPASRGPAAAGPNTYRVVRGDSLSRIAVRYKTSVRTLISLNKLRNPGMIRVGQVLNVPGVAPAPAVPQPPAAVEPAANQAPVPSQRENIPARPPTPVVNTVAPAVVRETIERYSALYGVDPALMKGLAWQESGWKQHVVSPAGAIGVMQVLPETGNFISKNLLHEPVNLQDMEGNVKAGVRFFAFYLSKTNGDEYTAVAGYFQGLRSVWQNGISQRTRAYADAVMALRQRFK
ncbi:MAG: LysM peptidoglycan-binding domain-containing protein [Actinomycetota bacterium]